MIRHFSLVFKMRDLVNGDVYDADQCMCAHCTARVHHSRWRQGCWKSGDAKGSSLYNVVYMMTSL